MLFREALVSQRRIHFIGIGGIGMSGIAEILLNLGYKISGSDLRRSAATDRLARMGAAVFEGHAAEHIRGADAVAYSSAISAANPEFAAARREGIPMIMRGELLAELMRLKFGVAVAGSHGKTTTTSMTAAVLHGGNKDPTVVVGGRVGSMGSNARLGNSEILLVEADESDGSFLKLAPIIALLTNVDREHMDHYGSIEAVEAAFLEFAEKTPFYGATLLCLDDQMLRRLAKQATRRVRTYGFEQTSPDADLTIRDVEYGHLESRFTLSFRGEDLGVFELQAAGRHNVLNAAGAALIGLELNCTPDQIRDGLRGYIGVDRRFQLRGVRGDVAVVDDYGHHPTEIRATLAAAGSCDYARVLVVFQPHRYSRTQALADDFAKCFGDCDRLWVTDIYPAGEEPLPGVSGFSLAESISAAGGPPTSFVDSIESAVAGAAAEAQPGDVILTLGAGSIWRAGESILSALDARFEGEPQESASARQQESAAQ